MICAVLLLAGNLAASGGLSGLYTDNDTEYLRTRVVDILSRDEKTYPLSDTEVARMITLTFTAEVTEGERRGEVLTVIQQSDPYYQAELNEVRVGDSVIVAEVPDMENIQYHAHIRTTPLIVMVVVIAVGLLCFARFKGLTTLVTLGFTLLSVYAVLVPAILSGQNIYVWAAVIALFLAVMPPMLAYGPSGVSLCAAAGSFAGSLFTMAGALLMDRILEFTGVIDEQSNYLAQINADAPISLRGILFACIVLVGAGAQSALAWKLSDAVSRRLSEQPTLSKKHLFRFGAENGRRSLSASMQTVAVAFIGASLPSTLLVFSSNISLLSFFNRELILFQILQLAAGLAGVLVTAVLTPLICALLFPTVFSAVYLPKLSGGEQDTASAGWPDVSSDADKVPPSGEADPVPKPEAAEASGEPETNGKEAPPQEPEGGSGVDPVSQPGRTPSGEETPQPPEEDPENANFRLPEISEEEQKRRDEIDAVEEDARQMQSYRGGFFRSFVRLYRELDEDFDAADERSRRRHGYSKK